MKKRIVICGSMSFAKEMILIYEELNKLGYKTLLPITLSKYGKTAKELTSNYKEFIKLKKYLAIDHFKKIKKSDGIIVVNKDKNKIKGYIGGATFSEMSLAFYLKKKIFLLKEVPKNLPYSDEIQSFEPIVLKDLKDLKLFL